MNDYSSEWIDTFLTTIDPAQTASEVAFLQRELPIDRFPRVLDICCGLGRHAGGLALLGYDVTGIDRDPVLIAQAQLVHPRARFVAMDSNRVATLHGSFDAIICMWQSFGYLDSTGNDRLLASIQAKLRPGGRFVLDIYNRQFFESRQGTLTSKRNGREIRETKSLRNGRLHVELIYDDDPNRADHFDWEVFSAEEIAARARGLTLITACTAFDRSKSPSTDSPRMQLVFERAR